MGEVMRLREVCASDKDVQSDLNENQLVPLLDMIPFSITGFPSSDQLICISHA